MDLLTETQISDELATVPGWTRDGDSITTVTERADFRDALLYLGAVAYLAETANHHPDVTINWNKVTLILSTHSAGGLQLGDAARHAGPGGDLDGRHRRRGESREARGGNGRHVVPPGQWRQARGDDHVRQRALLPGQPERPVRPAADAEPAEILH